MKEESEELKRRGNVRIDCREEGERGHDLTPLRSQVSCLLKVSEQPDGCTVKGYPDKPAC